MVWNHSFWADLSRTIWQDARAALEQFTIPLNKLLWTPSLKRRGSTKRRKSVLLGLDMDDDSSSGDESFRGTK